MYLLDRHKVLVGKCQMRVYDHLKANSRGHTKRKERLTGCRVISTVLYRIISWEKKNFVIAKSQGLETASMKSSSFPIGILSIFSCGHWLKHCFPSGVFESWREQKTWANSVRVYMILTVFSFLSWQAYDRPSEQCTYCLITPLLMVKLGTQNGVPFLLIWSGSPPDSAIMPCGWELRV